MDFFVCYYFSLVVLDIVGVSSTESFNQKLCKDKINIVKFSPGIYDAIVLPLTRMTLCHRIYNACCMRP